MDTVDNTNRCFKGQQKNEIFKCFFRRHWIVLGRHFILFSIFLLIMLIAVVEIRTIQEVLRGNRELKILFFTGFLIGTIYFHRFFVKMLNHFINIVIITNMRVIEHYKTLFFVDNTDSIDMAQIQNLERIKQGLLPTLLKYGDIKIYLNASDTVKTLHRVPSAKVYYNRINELKEERQRGILEPKAKVEEHIKAFETFINPSAPVQPHREKGGLKITPDLKIMPENEEQGKNLS